MEFLVILGGFWQRKTNPIQSQSYLAPSTAGGLKTYLKKQSQFLIGENDVNLTFTMTYGDFNGRRTLKNKPNSKPN